MSRKQRVFLSYAHEDLDTVQTLYDDLKKREVNVWLDKVDLGKGTWKKQIRKAIAQSSDFILCLSQAALRDGFSDLNTPSDVIARSVATKQSHAFSYTHKIAALPSVARNDSLF